MLSKEEINEAIEAFDGSTISSTLEEYLMHIASTGITLLQWTKIKPLVSLKIEYVLTEWHAKNPIDIKIKKANMENVSFEEMKDRLQNALNSLNGIPFTIQRICEMLTDKNVLKQYKMIDKYMRGLEKNLLIVTSVDPLGNRVVNESKLLLNGEESPSDVNTYLSTSSNENGSSSFHCSIISTTSSATSSSWYTSLANVVDSPSSYPNWKHIRDDTTKFEPPTKMPRFENDVALNSVDKEIGECFEASQNQDSIYGQSNINDNDNSVQIADEGCSSENVVSEVAPLLKQLLNCERVETTIHCDSTDVAEFDQENSLFKDPIEKVNLVEIGIHKSDFLEEAEKQQLSSNTSLHPSISCNEDSTEADKNIQNTNDDIKKACVPLKDERENEKIVNLCSGDVMQVEKVYDSVKHGEDVIRTSVINTRPKNLDFTNYEQNMEIN